MGNKDAQNVIITDINMPIDLMAKVIFKWTIASIPTMIFLFFIVSAVFA